MVISRPASRDKFPPELPVTLIAFDTVISWLALRYTSVPAFNKSCIVPLPIVFVFDESVEKELTVSMPAPPEAQ